MIPRLQCIYRLFHSWVYLVILVSISARVLGAANIWEVQYGNTDLTNAAAAIPTADVPLLNISSIGPILGILVSPQADGAQLRTPDGKRWTWEAGSNSLVSDGQIMPLHIPGIQQGMTLYLDADTIAELANLTLTTDADAKKLIFTSKDITEIPPQPEIGDGWKSFSISKPKSETKKSSVKQSVQQEELSPLGKDRLDFGVGLGYVQHADFGLELTANGKAAGGDMNFWGLVTQGNQGTILKNSHLNWLDRERGIGFEAGDLYSEAWGLVRGVRYTWNAGGNRWPSIGGYIKNHSTDNPHSLFIYRDELQIGKNLKINGDLGTDQSRFLAANYKLGNMELFGFQRQLPDNLGKNDGVVASYALSPSSSIFYGWNSSTDTLGAKNVSRNIGVYIPILKRYNLILNKTEYDSERSSSTVYSAGMMIPITNSVNMYIRYQKNLFAGGLINIQHNDSNSLLTSLSLSASPRLNLNYQMSRYMQEGKTSDYQQVVANYRISNRTSLQAITSFPNIMDSNLLRLRLERQMKNGMSLTVDYGRLASYQRADDLFGQQGFMVMLRKTWPLSVPAIGGKVSGRVLDQLGQPIESVVVQLGQYKTLSDKSGAYSFNCIPTGMYQISIPSESVPADYKVDAIAQQVNIRRNSRYTFDLTLVPLGSLTGYVYMDKNSNGECDFGEGISDIAVCANDHSTATDRTGRFSFYNLEPIKYKVRIATEVLDKRYVVKGISEMDVEIQSDKSVTGLQFQLEEHKKPILFTKLD